MRVLLLDAEDSPLSGPWSRQHWDLIVDMGKSSRFSEETWARQCGCRIVRADSLRRGVADAKQVREIFSEGGGRLIDEEGIDWWDLMSLLVAPQVFSLIALRRLAVEISPTAEVWATQRGESLRILESLLDRSVCSFEDRAWARPAARALHYAGLFRRLSTAQIKEIVLDKYDSGYRWRSRFAARKRRQAAPVVLLPSAYGNVSRMASSYARLLPAQSFLMVATRASAKQFVPPSNVQVRDLAAYATARSSEAEVSALIQRWMKLKSNLEASAEFRVLARAGVLEPFPGWIRDGLSARDAWRGVLDREPVCGVMCGDDSNLYTRLPVLLAARRKIPTVDFHHGALDGRYVLKDLPCDLYLAKNEMERDYLLRVCGLPAEQVVIGAPPSAESLAARKSERGSGASALFFSEPYEASAMRAEEVYREILPSLCRVARETECDVILKLHPFESLAQRRRILRDVLAPEDRKMVTVIDGPLNPELMARARFGITVESTTVIDCLQNGICCFVCGWLSLSPYEYTEQYARFAIGEILDDARQIGEIPGRLADFHSRPAAQLDLAPTADPAMLQRWLTTPQASGARSAS